VIYGWQTPITCNVSTRMNRKDSALFQN